MPKARCHDDMGVEHGVDKAAYPLRERTYEVVASLLAELAAVFPDEYIHLGGDEIDAECWLHDSEERWAREAASNGADWKAALQGAFTRRVLALLPPLGKRAVLWDEALETGCQWAPRSTCGGIDEGADGAPRARRRRL